MSATPVLSVIVTSYNLERYLAECLDSVLGQTFTDMEVIVVDDGSTDATPAIIADYAARDRRVVPVLLGDNSPGGVATAANAGLERARGTYVGFADGDDRLEPAMFERLVAAIEGSDADLAMCNYRLFTDGTDEGGAPADEARWEDYAPGRYELDVTERRRLLAFVAVPWRKLYRRELLDAHAIRFPVGDYFYEDNPFHWEVVVAARSVAMVPEVLCHHRLARPGQTMATADARLFRIFEHAATIRSMLVDSGQLEPYASVLASWVVSQLEWIARRTPSELRPELFAAASQALGLFAQNTVRQGLVVGRKGVFARQVTGAILAEDPVTFEKAFAAADAKESPLRRTAYHLRHTGVVGTGAIAARYVRREAAKAWRRSRPVLRRPAGPVTNRDLLFALAVLDERLASVEAQLAEQRSSNKESPS